MRTERDMRLWPEGRADVAACLCCPHRSHINDIVKTKIGSMTFKDASAALENFCRSSLWERISFSIGTDNTEKNNRLQSYFEQSSAPLATPMSSKAAGDRPGMTTNLDLAVADPCPPPLDDEPDSDSDSDDGPDAHEGAGQGEVPPPPPPPEALPSSAAPAGRKGDKQPKAAPLQPPPGPPPPPRMPVVGPVQPGAPPPGAMHGAKKKEFRSTESAQINESIAAAAAGLMTLGYGIPGIKPPVTVMGSNLSGSYSLGSNFGGAT